FTTFLCLLLTASNRIGSEEVTQNLLDTSWSFRNRSDDPKLLPLSGIATVPGDIYADLQALRLIDDPLYADNDVRLRWVARENWTYSTQFDVDDGLLKKPHHIIVFDGLDTIAQVILNGDGILSTNNQFVQYTADVAGKLKQTGNKLEIHFESPISYGDRAAREYEKDHGYSIPPDCTIEMFHGECHANYVRKIQAQFSWDWGPAFPTVGIFETARLVGHDGLHVERVHIDTTISDSGTVNVLVHADVRSAIPGKVHWDIRLPEMDMLHNVVTVLARGNGLQTTTAQFKLNKKEYELWWPNGMGAQKMYEMNVRLTRQDKRAFAERTVRFGIRKVELIQDFIDESNHTIGRNFYFKINDQPIFLKGSNWIPVSPFPSRNNSERMEFLLESSRIAGMNAMRVWGGGRYENEEFYELADRKGILLWHDMMFACSLYPTDPAFLESVTTEITQNVKRLKNHPSVLVWAGNNENELGLSGGWWGAVGYDITKRVADYKKLYKDVIGKIVADVDPSRPYLLSSPSNGIETDLAGGVSEHPSNPRYGDIHFYNEVKNLWKDSSYETPRCATEYGLQSIPSGMTMSKYLPQSEYSYFSGNFTHRQHHPGGVETLITMIFAHFPLPMECSQLRSETSQSLDGFKAKKCVAKTEGYIGRFSYFTQFHQALTYKTETEHYLRFRGRLSSDGLGHTMCALYWQLNDVWAAPTWSTIDWDLRWKPAHYEARRFFAPQLIVLFLNDNAILEGYATNDHSETMNDVTVLIQVFAFSNGFEPVYSLEKKMDLPPYSSTSIDLVEVNKWSDATKNMDLNIFVFTGELRNLEKSLIGYQSTVVPDRLWKVDLKSTGDVKIRSFVKKNDLEYRLVIEASAVAPLVWVEVQVDNLLAFFDDNAFTMTVKSRELTLKLTKKYERNLITDDVYVCALKSCYA
ncbi:hypothetical protein PFISCL1PPCAC_14407, partial [Pristionchus fissidentatus]